jgi:hypothetical protein
VLQKIVYIREYDFNIKKTEWLQWERVNHHYDRVENGLVKEMVTKKTVKEIKNGTVSQLIEKFENELPAYKKHIFNWKHQQRKYQECVANLKQNEVLILVDFSENYVCKMREEIQSMHFGASKHQITLHCGMIYWRNKSQSFCTISDSKCHNPSGIWAHLLPILKLVKDMSPETNTLHFFSDGPSSQYRQKKNFYLVNFFTKKLGFTLSTWSFSESGHGKGVADGIGGAIKRALDRQVAYGKDITEAREAFHILNSCMKSVQCFYIPTIEIDDIHKFIPKKLSAVSGTMKIHQIISYAHSAQIQHRTLSCFCFCERSEEQVCNCFSPKTHIFPNNKDKEELDDFIANNISANNEHGSPASAKKNEIDDFVHILPTDKDNLNITSLADSKDDNDLIILDDIDDFVNNNDINYGESAKNLDVFELKSVRIESPINLFDNIPQQTPSEVNRSQPNCEKERQSLFNKNISLPKSKSLRTIISRSLLCFLCKNNYPFYSNLMVKCMACKNIFCINCTDGQRQFDYICNSCYQC